MQFNFKHAFLALLLVKILIVFSILFVFPTFTNVLVTYPTFENIKSIYSQLSGLQSTNQNQNPQYIVDSEYDKYRQQTRIFCFILTTPSTISTKGRTVYEAWANECDMKKFVFKFPTSFVKDNPLLYFGNFNYKSNGSIDVNHLLEPENLSNESGNHRRVTEKVFATLAYAYTTYSRYDWYLKADDDTFIFVRNLRKFLADKNSTEPVTYGYNFRVRVPGGYHSGGAGYVLSHEALARIGQELVKGQNRTCNMTGVEDVDVARCLRKLGVKMGNSSDELGRERFHPLSIRAHLLGNYPKWLYFFAQNKLKSVCLLVLE